MWLKSISIRNEDADELISIGTVGLIKAVLTFDHTEKQQIGGLCGKMH